MTEILVKIMVEVLTILGIATKGMKCGRMSELIPQIHIVKPNFIQESFDGICGVAKEHMQCRGTHDRHQQQGAKYQRKDA